VSLLIDDILHAQLNYTTIAAADYPAALRHLIQEQTASAGELCYAGSSGVPGGRNYKTNIFMQFSNTAMTTTARSWSPCSPALFRRKCLKSWELRNTHVHGHDAITAAAATKKKLFAKIKLLHSRRNEALEHDRQYLILNLCNFFRSATPTTMQNWLACR
jgi:hypothetical protein